MPTFSISKPIRISLAGLSLLVFSCDDLGTSNRDENEPISARTISHEQLQKILRMEDETDVFHGLNARLIPSDSANNNKLLRTFWDCSQSSCPEFESSILHSDLVKIRVADMMISESRDITKLPADEIRAFASTALSSADPLIRKQAILIIGLVGSVEDKDSLLSMFASNQGDQRVIISAIHTSCTQKGRQFLQEVRQGNWGSELGDFLHDLEIFRGSTALNQCEPDSG